MTVGPGYGAAGVARAQMRASTEDRDRAVELLTRAYTEGRLTKDEHDARVERAMTATTFAELDAVVIDLPGAGPVAPVPPAPPQWAKTNSLAITSLICGIAQFMFGPLATIPAVVCGHMARSQIRRTGEQGAGMALAGLILGWIGVGFTMLVLIAAVLLVAAATSGGGPPG
ncbi:MAG TPA: DUF1707 and DUF4190 domain-containing protein [Streptosporangiaceae bacterium]|nr:DUF1707 and DUF4190 domain-containing protein [Streptosporangiaceae bacterium]